jgi:hypothetical protein
MQGAQVPILQRFFWKGEILSEFQPKMEKSHPWLHRFRWGPEFAVLRERKMSL